MTQEEREAAAKAKAEHLELLKCAVLYLVPSAKRGAALAVLEEIVSQAEDAAFQDGWVQGRAELRAALTAEVPELSDVEPFAATPMPDGEKDLIGYYLPRREEPTRH